jgi:DNA-binding response OmpR family regulator
MNGLIKLKNMNVLYVDDQKEACEKLKDILQYFFNKVYLASNGSEALEIYNKKNLHLLLVDYDMPIMDGNEFLKKVREKDKTIPAVIISSYEEKEKLKNAIKLNLVEYLLKPYSLDELKRVLGECVAWIERLGLDFISLNENCHFDFGKKCLFHHDKEIQLTYYEGKILECLLKRQNIIVHYNVLLDSLGSNSTKKSLITLIYQLKKKIGYNAITNVKEIGYMIKVQ